jgi:hypothetical protein
MVLTEMVRYLQLAMLRAQVCSSKGKRAKCMEHPHVRDTLKQGQEVRDTL